MNTNIDLLDAKNQRLIKRRKYGKKWRESEKGREYEKIAHAEWRAKNKESISSYNKKWWKKPEARAMIPIYRKVKKINFIRKHSIAWDGFTNRETWKYATMSGEPWDSSTDSIVMDSTKTKREIAKLLGRSLSSIKMRRYLLAHNLATKNGKTSSD